MVSLFNNLSAALRGGIAQLKPFFVTLNLTGTALIIGLLSLQLPLLEWLCFDYDKITNQHQYWRLISAHFVHSSPSHLFWDMSAFALLAGYLELKNRRLLVMGVTMGIGVISAYLLSPVAVLAQYCGLSAVVYTLVVISLWQWQKSAGLWLTVMAATTVVIKSLLEQLNQSAVFVSDGWSVASDTHLIGILAGILVLLVVPTGNKKAAVNAAF